MPKASKNSSSDPSSAVLIRRQKLDGSQSASGHVDHSQLTGEGLTLIHGAGHEQDAQGQAANAQESADYIADMLSNLEVIAQSRGLDVLNLLLAMAREQAQEDASQK